MVFRDRLQQPVLVDLTLAIRSDVKRLDGSVVNKEGDACIAFDEGRDIPVLKPKREAITKGDLRRRGVADGPIVCCVYLSV
jgi:hypothetical protein